MNTQEDLSRRLDSVRDLQSVVGTMKSLAAANIVQYERAADATREYDHIVQLALQVLLQSETSLPSFVGNSHRLSSRDASSASPAGIIVFGTDQGLCGRFNEEIANEVRQYLESHPRESQPMAILVGARLSHLLESRQIKETRLFRVPVNVPDITILLQDIMPKIALWQRDHHVQRIDLFYNRRTSTASFEPVHQPLLPLDPKFLQRLKQRRWDSRGLPFYRLTSRELLSGVLQQFLFIQLYRASAESRASENASRIASMQKAEKNIEEKLANLQTEFNQQRQNLITDELLDIISGFQVAMSRRGE